MREIMNPKQTQVHPGNPSQGWLRRLCLSALSLPAESSSCRSDPWLNCRFAANALLKTLEEPPARTLLILVATAPSRLPPTVLSRCQRLRGRAPTRAEALAWLERANSGANWGPALDTIGERNAGGGR